MIILFFVLLFSTGTLLSAQDSSSVQSQIDNLKARLDSLETLINNFTFDSLKQSKVDSELRIEKSDSSESDDLLSDITAYFSFNEQDQNSRRKRIDDLLNALQKQPGKISFNGNATSILHWKTGHNHFTNGSGSFDIFAFVGFGDNTKLFIDLEAVGGNGPNERINSFSSLNDDAGSLQNSEGRDLIHVREAWSEFNFLSDWFRVTLGKIDLTNYFDINEAANDETMQFISGPFVNSAAFPVPSNSPGMRAFVGIENLITFQLGLVSQDNSGSRLFTELFKIFGTELNADFGEGYYGKIHFYVYKDGIASSASGYGFSFSGTVANQFKLFGRWNENNTNYSNSFPVRKYWSIGTEFNSLLFDKPLVIGAAFGKITPYQDALNDELICEAYVRFQFNRWIYVSPHIQIIQNAAGSSSGYLLAAVRTQINF